MYLRHSVVFAVLLSLPLIILSLFQCWLNNNNNHVFLKAYFFLFQLKLTKVTCVRYPTYIKLIILVIVNEINLVTVSIANVTSCLVAFFVFVFNAVSSESRQSWLSTDFLFFFYYLWIWLFGKVRWIVSFFTAFNSESSSYCVNFSIKNRTRGKYKNKNWYMTHISKKFIPGNLFCQTEFSFPFSLFLVISPQTRL